MEEEPVAVRCVTDRDPVRRRGRQGHALRRDETDEVALRLPVVGCCPHRAFLVEDPDNRVGKTGVGEACQRPAGECQALSVRAEDVDEQVPELSESDQVVLVE